MTIIGTIADNAGAVFGMDCMEFAPIPSLVYPDYTVARALYASLTTFYSRSLIPVMAFNKSL